MSSLSIVPENSGPNRIALDAELISQMSSLSIGSGNSRPNRIRVPQSDYRTYPKQIWAPKQMYNSISFDYVGSTGQGVSLVHLTAHDEEALAPLMAGGDEPMVEIEDAGYYDFLLAIHWPGYENRMHFLDGAVTPLGIFQPLAPQCVVSRAGLAKEVSKCIFKFVVNTGHSHLRGNIPEWDLSLVDFTKLTVVGIRNAPGIWQPEILMDVEWGVGKPDLQHVCSLCVLSP
ncbi:hypothetical protein CC1G_09928 [Coprinopsis cinerea okayama7|uniref:Uncharacterized protein n=1 Tax=Coprinopsis cinerea (strain Okayama-7 / 130 / ATCC MYA-4618 / FGSC 9003) TaxID=240176 RepID=A8NN20_COPC7|nr:hypothetical protein CC1G_09928 [Coprinopsis cinerea okayama7\|eukprot:XP_001835037.2 hypothetical protein CC1G_09928 [Coprinopsis cinerea okayama7\